MNKLELPKSVSDVVLEQLRSDIINNRFELGEKISEAKLSEYYGVTKAPIRAAYSKLETEGLVVIRPQAGTFVCKPTMEEVKALCELRIALELEAIGLAMQRSLDELKKRVAGICDEMELILKTGDQQRYQQIDTELHSSIVSLADSPLLSDTYQLRVTSLFATLRTRFSMNREHNDYSLNEHRQLSDLVNRSNIGGAQDLLRSHIMYTERYYRNSIKSDEAERT